MPLKLPLLPPPQEGGVVHAAVGPIAFYHYLHDGFDDCGWGCGYRTAQTMCEWLTRYIPSCAECPFVEEEHGRARNTVLTAQPCSPQPDKDSSVPDIGTMQQTLVDIEDKPALFAGSRDWVGSNEICYVIDTIYNIPCRILRCNSARDAKTTAFLDSLQKHFSVHGSPIMCGGTMDNRSRAILGLWRHPKNDSHSQVLVLDPHYVHPAGDMSTDASKSEEGHLSELVARGWYAWKSLDSFSAGSYNFCCPVVQRPAAE